MNEREIIEKQIEDHQKVVDEAKQRLADLDKPQLRHGDYGYDEDGDPRITLTEWEAGRFTFAGDYSLVKRDLKSELTVKYKTGNIFDDLKRNSNDLTEFYGSGQYDKSAKMDKTFSCSINGYDSVWMRINTGSSLFTIEEFKKICQQSNQLLATLERKGK